MEWAAVTQGSMGRPSLPSFAPLIADGLEMIHTYMTSLLFRPTASVTPSTSPFPPNDAGSSNSAGSEFFLSLPPIDHQSMHLQSLMSQQQQQHGHHHRIPISSASYFVHSDHEKHLIQESASHLHCCSCASKRVTCKMCPLTSG